MNGKRIGLETAARMNVVLNEMRDACAGDPEALIEAASVVSHLLSLSNEDAPLTQVIRRMRVDAICELAAQGLSDQRIADKLGMSRSRVQQLRTSRSEGARKGLERPRKAPVRATVEDTLPGFDAA